LVLGLSTLVSTSPSPSFLEGFSPVRRFSTPNSSKLYLSPVEHGARVFPMSPPISPKGFRAGHRVASLLRAFASLHLFFFKLNLMAALQFCLLCSRGSCYSVALCFKQRLVLVPPRGWSLFFFPFFFLEEISQADVCFERTPESLLPHDRACSSGVSIIWRFLSLPPFFLSLLIMPGSFGRGDTLPWTFRLRALICHDSGFCFCKTVQIEHG